MLGGGCMVHPRGSQTNISVAAIPQVSGSIWAVSFSNGTARSIEAEKLHKDVSDFVGRALSTGSKTAYARARQVWLDFHAQGFCCSQSQSQNTFIFQRFSHESKRELKNYHLSSKPTL